ncbi:MAG TPA: aldolase/citrate lyase family protein [Bacteroidales bacterium]|nr:aldolase/citrate lyase family protein [Bacteroidales bacterium]
MIISPAISGNSGPKVRSDCEVTLELQDSGGIHIELESKVRALYGESIKELVTGIIEFFGIRNIRATIKDSGALPFVIAARTEASVKKLIKTGLEFLPPVTNGDNIQSSRDRCRYSRLYLPGNNPSLMINAGLHSAEGLILDLEDSVAPEKKDEARILVRNALRQISFYGAERMVRINQGERGSEDLRALIPHGLDLVLLPKCESSEEVKRISSLIDELKNKDGITNEVFLMPIIETAAGVENAYSIATSDKSVVSIAIGLEDYTADLGVKRTPSGNESLYARTRLVNAAKAAGIQPIDSVFSDIDDLELLKETVRVSKSLGFEGMGCIHPRQIPFIRQGYAPDEGEIEKSRKIVVAFEEARAKGLGVICLGSKMIDAPVVRRAERIIKQAVSMGLLPADWMNIETKVD